jgi:DNA polymerase-3 subunit epsilon
VADKGADTAEVVGHHGAASYRAGVPTARVSPVVSHPDVTLPIMRVNWPDADMLAFDLETTGVDRFTDVPVSFALLLIRDGRVVDRRRRLVDPGREIPTAATAIHGITTEEARARGVPLQTAVPWIARVLIRASRRGMPVAGMCLGYDLTLLDACLQRITGAGLVEAGWRGPVLDASVIDRRVDRYRRGRRTLVALCEHYAVPADVAHEASADALAAVDVLRATAQRFPKLAAVPLDVLFRWQVRWHREWALSYSEWRSRNGLSPLATNELEWPLAPPPEPEATAAVA